MGGGDLNLKKSWHPHTMKNQEKVWKAEQAKSQEEKKLNDLRKEIEEEKNREELTRIGKESGVLDDSKESNKKLDWMYKSSTELINRDEYLLGRKIDKSFEILQAEEQQKEQQNLVGVKQPLNHVEHECVPFSIRAYKNLQNTEQVDLQRKVMEDPLMLIKQREMESRRKILENPVKLKELHRILKTDEKLRQVSKKVKKSKKNKKSKKKSKKRSYSSSTSFECPTNNDSDSDIDKKLAKKLKDGLLDKDKVSNMGLNLSKLLDTKYEKISQELDKAAGKNKKQNREKKSKNVKSDTDSNSEKDETYLHRQSLSKSRKVVNKYRYSRSVSRNRSIKSNISVQKSTRSLDEKKKKESSLSISLNRGNNSRNRSRSLSRDIGNRYSNKTKYRSRSRSPHIKMRFQSKSPRRYDNKSARSQYRSPSRSQVQRRSNRSKSRSHTEKRSPDSSSSTKSRSKKLSDEEKQAKLREMMSNAAWREEERTEVVRKHREAYAKEEEQYKTLEFDEDFTSKEVKKAIANQTSVGSRLRANLNNIQRTSAAMNSNFARK